ncbi:MAG: hypothetical protein KDC73_03230 [Ignavibacteriae bacterium]|nr:hypothetical protein [Ignavibacteriota bacterium]MCB9244267.1 hypothetical protein [Ignavibacteriales bacterium]
MTTRILLILIPTLLLSNLFAYCQKRSVDSVQYEGEFYYKVPRSKFDRLSIGDIKSDYGYSDNESLPNGKWIQFYNEGDYIPGRIFNLQNDTLNGNYVEIYENRFVAEEGAYSNGKKTGKWKYWYPNGVVKEEGFYTEGEETGEWESWYSDGSYKYKGKKGIRVAENGYVFNIYVGAWRWYFANGKIKNEGYYDDLGYETGKWKKYYENGQLKLEENYVNGKREGNAIKYYPNGQFESRFLYERGSGYYSKLKDSIYTVYYNNGQLKEKGPIYNGMRFGIWESWYENGQKKSKGNFIYKTYTFCSTVPVDEAYLLKEGEWTYWYPNGKKMAEGEYGFGKTNIETNCEGGADITTFYTTDDWEFWDENGKEVSKKYLLDKNIWEEDRQPMDGLHYMWEHFFEEDWEDSLPPGM